MRIHLSQLILFLFVFSAFVGPQFAYSDLIQVNGVAVEAKLVDTWKAVRERNGDAHGYRVSLTPVDGSAPTEDWCDSTISKLLYGTNPDTDDFWETAIEDICTLVLLNNGISGGTSHLPGGGFNECTLPSYLPEDPSFLPEDTCSIYCCTE